MFSKNLLNFSALIELKNHVTFYEKRTHSKIYKILNDHSYCDYFLNCMKPQ